MINAALVGLGRWGQRLVTSVQGKSDRIRLSGEPPRHSSFEAVDQVLVELELFANALAGRTPYPMTGQSNHSEPRGVRSCEPARS